jgi:hypothetical protein
MKSKALWIALLILGLSRTPALATDGYAAVWRPGSGEQRWRSGMTADEFKEQDQTYFDKGLRLTAVQIDNGRFLAVWRPGSGEQRWRSGMTADEFKKQDQTYFDKGLRLTTAQIAGSGFLGVWRPGSGEQRWRSGMTIDEFKKQDQTYFDKGLRLTTVQIRGGEFFAVWRPGSGEQRWRSGMTFNEFRAQDKTYFDKGLRITALQVHGGKYLAVWRPGGGEQRWFSVVCFDDFKSQDKVYFDRGLRLVALQSTSGAGAIYRLPFDNDSAWQLWNGNYDDPKSGHSKGNPNGLQAYAFDFVHDKDNNGVGEGGQNVRAARDGTVYVVVESETKNSKGSTDLCKDGVGNYLVVDHGDGTFGTYWHLSHDGVKVKVGDPVKRGQIVAVSGNTGTSDTAHIHFDVRTGWNKAYDKCHIGGNELPSIRIMFQDENHSCWIPRAGDKLESNNQ